MTFQNSETGIIKAGRFTVQTGPVAIINVNDTCLSHAERDVAYVEPPSLTRHLAAHNRHRTRSHSQTLRGHCREQGSCRNLASSWAKNSQAIIHTTSLLSFTHLHSLTDQHAAQVSIVFCTAGIYLMVRVLIPTNNSLSVIHQMFIKNIYHTILQTYGCIIGAHPTLHGFVLHGCDVFEARRRNVPVLFHFGLLFLTVWRPTVRSTQVFI